MTKIAVSGKGGSGKSSMVALLAGGLSKRGYRVLVVDSDESNPGLYRMLGLEERPTPLLELVGGKKRVFDTFSKESEAAGGILRRDAIRISDLPREYVAEENGVALVCIGKILQSLEGCACPMGVLNREFLSRLSLREDEIVLVDMEAGIEHFGRGVDTTIDRLVIVTEPSLDSIELAEKMMALAAEVDMENAGTVLNNVPSEELKLSLRDELSRRGIPVIGSIGYEPEIFQSGLEGRPIRTEKLAVSIDSIVDQLI